MIKTNKNFLQSQVKTAGYIIYAVRVSLGLGQQETAQMLGVTQGYLSKVESGNMSPSLFFWFDFCNMYEIDKDCLSFGYLESFNNVEVRSTPTENGFKIINKDYQSNRCLKTRQMLPLLNILAEKKDCEWIDSFLRENFIHPAYFLNLNNQMNLKFADQLIITSASSFSKNGQFLNKLNQNLNGFFPTQMKELELERLLLKLSTYQKTFNYQLQKRAKQYDLEITLDQNASKEFSECDERTITYLENLNVDFIPQYVGYPALNKTGSFLKGDKRIELSFTA